VTPVSSPRAGLIPSRDGDADGAVVSTAFTETPEVSRSTTHFDIVATSADGSRCFPRACSGAGTGARAADFADRQRGRCRVRAGSRDAVGEFLLRRFAIVSSLPGSANGGFLSHRLACEAADVFAAIGVGSGQMTMPMCMPSRPIPVIQAHGTSDPVVPYGGNVFLGYPRR